MGTTVTPAPAPAPSSQPATDAYGMGARISLAALSAGAGVVHLAMAPVHAGASTLEGVGFALAGWFQLIAAAVILLRPDRRWFQATLAANLVFIGVWAWSRTVGLPIGAHPGEVEAVSSLDLLTVVLEGLLVLGSGLVLARPATARSSSSGALVLASAVPVAVLILTTMAIASPSASEHDHGDVEVTTATGPAPGSIEAQLATIEATRCDKDLNPASYWNEAAQVGVDTVGVTLTDQSMPATASDGHAHDHGTASATASPTTSTTLPDPLGGRGSVLLDKLVSKMGSESEIDAGMLVAGLAEATPEEYQAFLYQLRASGATGHNHSASGDDTGGHGGHIGPNPWVAMTDPAQCDRLKSELGQARDVALSMPTAADAKAAGYTQVTPYVPGIAGHWMRFDYVDGRFEVDKPEMVLYDGNGLDARVVGLSYYVVQPGDAEPTQGFTGPNDHFHRHIGLCQRGAMVIGDSTMSEADCAAAGGTKGTNRNGWMNHVWIVPGCESPWGMFSGASPLLDKKIAEVSGQNDGHCAGSSVRDRYDLSPGAPTPTTTAPAPSNENAAGR